MGRRLSLSTTEIDLLACLADGLTVAAAAAKMFVSKRTAESIVAQLRRQTGARSLDELALIAERQGWHERQSRVTASGEPQ